MQTGTVINLGKRSPFGGIPRNWKLTEDRAYYKARIEVPPSGGSLEIGNKYIPKLNWYLGLLSSPFGGIPRNWKPQLGGSKTMHSWSSPFGGIPRNWKRRAPQVGLSVHENVPPSGGSLEIGNQNIVWNALNCPRVPPSGGSLEIGNCVSFKSQMMPITKFPLRGDP